MRINLRISLFPHGIRSEFSTARIAKSAAEKSAQYRLWRGFPLLWIDAFHTQFVQFLIWKARGFWCGNHVFPAPKSTIGKGLIRVRILGKIHNKKDQICCRNPKGFLLLICSGFFCRVNNPLDCVNNPLDCQFFTMPLEGSGSPKHPSS